MPDTQLSPVETAGQVPAISERERDTRRKRQLRFRKRVLESIWSPRGITPCGGPLACPWCPEGERCDCRTDEPCRCSRKAYDHLRQEGEKTFGGVIGGALAGLMVRTAEGLRNGSERAQDLLLKTISMLIEDGRKREILALQVRRLDLEAKSNRPYSEVLAGILGGPGTPQDASAASGSTQEPSDPGKTLPEPASCLPDERASA